ncbi:hypothetical protein B0H11DRAFT_2204173 [Mycena galericulata]|nr:hypothetical protein B0H11DRAFT_2204173 [Mycena galericulata]
MHGAQLLFHLSSSHLPMSASTPLSNTIRRGFHPLAEHNYGNPSRPPSYIHPPATFYSKSYVEDSPYASHSRADLCLEYVYDVGVEYLMGSEFVTLPIVERVYRRDPNLRWSEIRSGLEDGRIPSRYDKTGNNQAPMNAATFHKFLCRFYLAENSQGEIVIHEKGTRLPVERDHADFEWVLELILPNKFPGDKLYAFSAREWADEDFEGEIQVPPSVEVRLARLADFAHLRDGTWRLNAVLYLSTLWICPDTRLTSRRRPSAIPRARTREDTSFLAGLQSRRDGSLGCGDSLGMGWGLTFDLAWATKVDADWGQRVSLSVFAHLPVCARGRTVLAEGFTMVKILYLENKIIALSPESATTTTLAPTQSPSGQTLSSSPYGVCPRRIREKRRTESVQDRAIADIESDIAI